MSSERLQKILSQSGFGSRREMERWIEEGLVAVNGVIAKIGDVATADDKISVKGRIIINPLTASGQIEGGMIQALGYAVCEEMKYDERGTSEFRTTERRAPRKT